MSLKKRQELQSFFKTGAIPSGENFADLIDSFINQSDDGIGSGWHQLSGTLSAKEGSFTIEGTGTRFSNELVHGNEISIDGTVYEVSGVKDDDKLELTQKIHKEIKAADLMPGYLRSHLLIVQDWHGNVKFQISRDGLIGVGKIPQTALDVNGTVQATTFSGNGSALTNLSWSQFREMIPKEKIPSINEVEGLFTVSETSQALAGTVSGQEGATKLTVSEDFPVLEINRQIRIGTQVYEVVGFDKKQPVVKPALMKAIDKEKVYTAGDFLALDLDGKAMFHVDGWGNVSSKGGFAGDGSKLNNIKADAIEGLIDQKNLPPVDISEVNGLLKFHEDQDNNFLEFYDASGEQVADFSSKGNFRTKGRFAAEEIWGNGKGLTEIPAAAIKGIISNVNLPPAAISSIEGVLTVHEIFDIPISGKVSGVDGESRLTGEGTLFLSVFQQEGMQVRLQENIYKVKKVESDTVLTLNEPLKENATNQQLYVPGNFLQLDDVNKRRVLTIAQNGDLYTTTGKMFAHSFSGNGSGLTDIPVSSLKGVISPENLSSHISFFTDKTILNGEETAMLSWNTHSIDRLELQYMRQGRTYSCSTDNNQIQLQQDSFPVRFSETTTVSINGYKDGKMVDQQQLMITVIQNANQYGNQLGYEGFDLAYVLDMVGRRFRFSILTKENLTALTTAAMHGQFITELIIDGIPLYYSNHNQPWDNVVHGAILYKLLNADLQRKISQDVSDWANDLNVINLCLKTQEKYKLRELNADNLRYLAVAIRDTKRYSLEECFRSIPQFYRTKVQSWKPEEHGLELQQIFSFLK